MERFIYGNGEPQTKYITFECAGFSMEGRQVYYIIENEQTAGILYFSTVSFNSHLKTGLIKPLN